MDIMITTKNKEMFWADKYVISVGNSERCDLILDLPYEFLITIKYDFYIKNYVLVNAYKNPNILFCHQPVMKLDLGSLNKVYFKNTDEFLIIRILDRKKMPAVSPACYTYKEIPV